MQDDLLEFVLALEEAQNSTISSQRDRYKLWRRALIDYPDGPGLSDEEFEGVWNTFGA